MPREQAYCTESSAKKLRPRVCLELPSRRSSPSFRWCCTDRELQQGVTWGIFLRELRSVSEKLELLHISSATTHLLLDCQQRIALRELMGVLALDRLCDTSGRPVASEGALHNALKRQREAPQVSVAAAHGLLAKVLLLGVPTGHTLARLGFRGRAVAAVNGMAHGIYSRK